MTNLAQQLLDVMPDAVLMVREDGRILLANPQAQALFGYREEHLLNKPIEMLLPEQVHAAHREHRARFLAAPSTRPMGTGLDLRAKRMGGTEVPVDISVARIGSEEGPLVIAVIRDVSEHARLLAMVRH